MAAGAFSSCRSPAAIRSTRSIRPAAVARVQHEAVHCGVGAGPVRAGPPVQHRHPPRRRRGTDGTLEGDLVMRGDGDPALSSRFLQGDAAAPVELLAQLVASMGIKRVSGSLVADASALTRGASPMDGSGATCRTDTRHASRSLAQREPAVDHRAAWRDIDPGRAGRSRPGDRAQGVEQGAHPRRQPRGARHRRTLDDGTIEVAAGSGRARSRGVPARRRGPAMFTAGAFRRALEARASRRRRDAAR